MPKKISQLESAIDVTASDLVQIVDIEDVDMAASGTNKKCTAQLLANELGKITSITSTGSVTSRSLVNRFAETINVKDFGAKGDGVTDDSASIQAAIDFARSAGGGRVYIPRGVYAMASTISIYPSPNPPTPGWTNLTLEGDGQASILSFGPAPAGSAGLAIYGGGGRMQISRLQVFNAPSVGISINHGKTRADLTFVSRISIQDVIVNNCGSHGIEMTNTYMGSFKNIESRNNQGNGFHLNGNHTSLLFERCWAGGDAARPSGGNLGFGWFVNGAIYSTFESCSADWSGEAGWNIENCSSCSFLNCASESNNKEGFIVRTRNANRSNIAVADIYGVELRGLFGFNNSKAGVDSYANLLSVLTEDSRQAALSLYSSYSRNLDGTTQAAIYNGQSGSITISDGMNFYEGGTTTVSNNVFRTNTFLSGRSVIAGISANQSIPDTTLTKLTLNVENFDNLGSTLSSGEVVIPSGVNRIKVSANIYWDNNSTGFRFATIRKNGSTISGGGSSKVSANGFTQQNLSSGVIQVSAGDTISIWVQQTSTSSLNVISNPDTYLSVECIG